MKKMSKLFSLLMACTMMLTACGGGDVAEEKDSGSEKISIKCATVIAETHPTFKALARFRDNVSTASDGRIEVILYGGGQMGSQDENIDQLRMGDIQMCTVNPVTVTSTIPAMSVLEEYFLFDNLEHAYAVMDGDAGKMINDAWNAVGAQGIGFLPIGFSHMANNRRPLNTIEDMQSVEIRGYSPIQIAAFEAVGFKCTTVAWNELFTSLQQKMVNGCSLAPSYMISDKFAEVAPYYSLTNHEFSMDCLLAGQDFLNSLAEEDRAIIEEQAAEACNWLRGESERANDEYMSQLADFGCEVNVVSDEVRHEMSEIMGEVTTPIIAEHAGKDVYDTFKSYVEAARS